VLFQNFALVPCPNFHDIVVEPYNAILAMKELNEFSDQIFVYDNCALSKIVQNTLKSGTPKMQELNNVVALCMSGITSGMRFKGPLNADLRKMNQNLVPFKGLNLLCSSFAPLDSAESVSYRHVSVLDLAQQMLQRNNITCTCEPQWENHDRTDMSKKPQSRILAAWAAWRGHFRTQEVDRILYDMLKEGSRFDRFFPDWVPNTIASNMCAQPHCEKKDSVVFIANNTSIVDVLRHSGDIFDRMYKQNSFVHTFAENGVEEEDLRGARNHVRDLVSAYESKARLPDSLKEILGDGDEGAEASIVREYEELAKKQLMEIVLAKETKPRRR